jgi:multidrug efflux pump subunit AcrA (membrane-fusion protein)
LSSQSEQASLREQLAAASSEYKSSLEQLITIYESDAKKAEARLVHMKELLDQALVRRQDVDSAAEAFKIASAKLLEAQTQFRAADVEIAEALIEAKLEDMPPRVGTSRATRSGLVRNTAYIRYSGERAWSLAEVGPIQQFFLTRFGRALPIHVFGQSPLHDRWGYDHRNAMDIGLNPSSAEGQTLMNYLRSNGIPFTAFHFAIPGVATGPHIHIGLPSHRITVVSNKLANQCDNNDCQQVANARTRRTYAP